MRALQISGCTDASKALVIEDTVHGLQAARAAGTFAVGITNTLPADVLSSHADQVVAHLTDLDLATLLPERQAS